MNLRMLVAVWALWLATALAVPSENDLIRRAREMGDWEFLKRSGSIESEGLAGWVQQVLSDRSERRLAREVERCVGDAASDPSLRLMVLARLASARGGSGLLDRFVVGEMGRGMADILFARAWLKGIAGEGEAAERDWKLFLATYPADGRRGRAALMLARRLVSRGAYPEARVALRQGLDASSGGLMHAELMFETGTVQFATGDFGAALDSFRDSAEGVDYSARAFFNAGLAAIRVGDERAIEEVLKALDLSEEGRERVGALRAERIFERVRRGMMSGAELSDFLATGGGGRARADLQVVLALIRHREGTSEDEDVLGLDERELSSAGRRLALVLRLLRGDVGAGTLDGLSPLDWEGVGSAFMEIAGGAWFAAGDLVQAERAYTAAASEVTDAVVRQRSHLLAGVAAAASGEPDGMRRAMGYWDIVGQGGGHMALLARLHQGVLQMRTGNLGAALGVFEHVMRSNGASGEIRSIAGSCVAEVAFQAWERSGSGEDAERALRSLRSEVSSAAVGGRAYCRAQHRIGQLSSARGDMDAAVKVWRGLIAGTPDSSSAVQWVQSAGLALAALLEAKGDRAGAAAALDRVASFGGALAIEAVERAESVRLRGFLPLR